MDAIGLQGVILPFPQQVGGGPPAPKGHGASGRVGGKRNAYHQAIIAAHYASLLDEEERKGLGRVREAVEARAALEDQLMALEQRHHRRVVLGEI